MTLTDFQTRTTQIISARWIIPVEPRDIVLEHHSIVMTNGRIAAILLTADAHQRYPDAPETKLAHHVLIPGMINLHTHAAMTMAAQSKKPWAVFIAAALALTAVSAIGVVAGSVLGNYLPLLWIKRVAAVAFIVIGVLILAGKF